MKKKEWKRRLAHLLVVGLFVTSIPSTPVHAQEDVQDVPYVWDNGDVSGGDVSDGKVSGGDVFSYDVTDEDIGGEDLSGGVTDGSKAGTQSVIQKALSAGSEGTSLVSDTETFIVGMDATVKRDTFYYGVEAVGGIGGIVTSIEITYSDGKVETCSLWSNEWYGYGFQYLLLDAEGNPVWCDDNGNTPLGNYIFRIYLPDTEVDCEVPVKVIPLDDVATELAVGDSLYGLSGTTGWNYWDYTGGHWLKMELSESGVYEVKKSANGYSAFLSDEGYVQNDTGGETMSVRVTEPGTYYCYVKGEGTFDVTLTKQPKVESIMAITARDCSYYEVETLYISDIITSLELTLDNGTVETCSLRSNEWYGYGFHYELLDAEGNIAETDDNYKYPVGEYTLRVYSTIYSISCDIPVKVVSLDDIATALAVGDSLNGLSGTENYGNMNYTGGHWLKMELSESGMYEVKKSAYGYTAFISAEGYVQKYTYDEAMNFRVTEPGTYYCCVKGEETFDVTLTKQPKVESIMAITSCDCSYYEVEDLYFSNIITSLELTLDNGTVETCSLWSNTWNAYGFQYELLDAEGNVAQRDDNYKYPVGEYTFRIYSSYDSISCDIPVKVVSLDGIATALAVGDSLNGLSGTENYDRWNYTDGHWLKMELDKAGIYRLSKTTYGMIDIRYPSGSSHGWQSSREETFTVSEMGTYYCYVKGSEAFDVSITKLPDIVSITANSEHGISYYEVSDIEISNVISSLKVTFDNETVETCSPWDNLWYTYGMSYEVLDEAGEIAKRDENYKYAIGSYICKVTTSNGKVSCEIPVKVVSVKDVATELKVGESVTGLFGTENYNYSTYRNGHWLKLELDQPGVYKISKSKTGIIRLTTLDGYSDDWYGATSARIQITEPTTYYCYVKGSNDFSVSLMKLPNITAMDAKVERSISYYGVEGVSIYSLIASVELSLDNGTKEECYEYDGLWSDYGLSYEILDKDGKTAQRDEKNNYAPGSYSCRIFTFDGKVSCTIPFEVVSVDDVAMKLALGDTLTGLAGTNNYYDWSYSEGHWIKMEFAKPGVYVLSQTVSGCMKAVNENGNSISSNSGKTMNIQASKAGTYYAYVKGNGTFDVTLTQKPDVTEMNAVIGNNKFYYEVEGGFNFDTLFESIELTLDDGTVAAGDLWSSVWYDYGLNYTIYDADGNVAQRDNNYKYPIGKYYVKISSSVSDAYCDIPVDIVSLDTIETKLTVGETLTGLSGTANYTSVSYINGHWIKMEFAEPGMYKLSKTAGGYMCVITPEGQDYGDYNGTYLAITVPAAGTYYSFVKGSVTFDVTISEMPNVQKLEAIVGRNEFCYDFEDVDTYELADINIILEDGTVEVCMNPYSSEWYQYGLKGQILDKDGKEAQLDHKYKYPIGDYTFKVSSYNDEVSCEIPFKVISADDLDKLEVGGKLNILGNDTRYMKLELEKGIYYFNSTNGNSYATLYDEDKNSFTSFYLSTYNPQNNNTFKIEQSGTYYWSFSNYSGYGASIQLCKFDIENLEIQNIKGAYVEKTSTMLNPSFSAVDADGSKVGVSVNSRLWNCMELSWNVYYKGTKDGIYVKEASVDSYSYAMTKPGYYCVELVSDFYDISARTSQDIVLYELGDADIPVMPVGKEISLLEAMNTGCYQFEITEAGLYELVIAGGAPKISGYFSVRDEQGGFYQYGSTSFYQTGSYSAGVLEEGKYYAVITGQYPADDSVTIKLNRLAELESLAYKGDKITFNYGEWGYKIEGDISSNVSTRPQSPNSYLSGNNINLPISVEGTLEGGNTIDIPFMGSVWRNYRLNYILCNKDGSDIYTDHNGYLANGEYLIKISSYDGAGLDIPFSVTGGPKELNSLEYTGSVQEFKYGTWGYSTKQLVSGNSLTTPKKANADLNLLLSGNNVLALDFSVTAETKSGDTDVISYGSKLWKWYQIKTYFYDAEGRSVCTDEDGYMPAGSYTMKCVTYDGVVCEIPFEVTPDAGKVAEEQLEAAVDQMLDAANKLADEKLANAEAEVQKEAVAETLKAVEAIYEEYDISKIGAVSAEKAIEQVAKLTDVEKQIEELLDTSVTVEAIDDDAEDMSLTVQNALLSVPAGEDAELRVSTAEIPEDAEVNREQAVAIRLELISEAEEKLQLQAPVIITMKIPEGIDAKEKIVVYHYSGDNAEAVEVVSVLVNGDGTMSFAIGSFSTFVIANAAKGVAVSGTVTSFGNTAEKAVLKLLDNNGTVVAETEADNAGMYQFETVAAGNYTLAVSKTNHVTREYSITVADEAVVQDVKIQLLGDITGDGIVNTRDWNRMYAHINETNLLTGYELLCADVMNSDGNVNVRDWNRLYAHINETNLLW